MVAYAWFSLLILSTLISGCGVTALEKRALSNYDKASTAYADFLEKDFPTLITGMMVIQTTSLALKPEKHFKSDPGKQLQSNTRFVAQFLGDVFRASGHLLIALREGDREFLNGYAKELAAVLKTAEMRFPGSSPVNSEELERMEKFDATTLSQEELKDMLIRQLSEYHPLGIAQLKSVMQRVIDGYLPHAVAARDKAFDILSDSEQGILIRLTAEQKYTRLAELSAAIETSLEKHDIALKDFSKTTMEVLKTVKDPKYTKEDLLDFLKQLEDFSKHIEDIVASVKRIAALILLL